MSLIQVVLRTKSGDERVYWVKGTLVHEDYRKEIRAGKKVILAEESVVTPLEIHQICTSLPETMEPWIVENLKARTGTILELL